MPAITAPVDLARSLGASVVVLRFDQGQFVGAPIASEPVNWSGAACRFVSLVFERVSMTTTGNAGDTCNGRVQIRCDVTGAAPPPDGWSDLCVGSQWDGTDAGALLEFYQARSREHSPSRIPNVVFNLALGSSSSAIGGLYGGSAGIQMRTLFSGANASGSASFVFRAYLVATVSVPAVKRRRKNRWLT